MSAPGAPTGITAAPGSGTATLTFTAGAANGSAIFNYKYSTDGTTYTALNGTTGAPLTSPITISGLTNNTWYTIYLKAVNANGDSVASAGVSVMPSVISIAPNSIGGIQVWYDARDPAGTSVLPGNGATVSSWKNKASGSYNATATSGKEATYDANKKALTFVSGKNYSTGYPANPATETMFVVFNNPSPDGNTNTLMAGQTGARAFGAGNATGVANCIGILNNQVAWLASTPVNSYTPNTVAIGTGTVSLTGATTSVAVNGGTASTATGRTPFTAGTTTSLGIDLANAAYFYAGYIMEIIIYNVALTTLQKQQVEGYLAWKWGIQSSLPSGHPYSPTTYTTGVATVSATISVAPTTSTVLTAQQTLANAVLTGGSANVSGTFAWTAPDTVPATGSSSQSITFTPTDSANYLPATTTATVNTGNSFALSTYSVGTGLAAETSAATGTFVDSSGNIYVRGYTSTSGVSLSGVNGGQIKSGTTRDTFVAKYNSSNVLQWGRFIAGSVSDYGNGIASDASGNVYVTGTTSTSGLTISGVSGGQTKSTTNDDAFLAKYNATGTLMWGKIIGGTGTEAGYGMSIDSSGNVYITSFTTTNGFTVSGLSGGSVKPSGSDADAFLAKYNTNGALLWGRFVGVGGSQNEQEFGSAIDTSGNIYVTGYTASTITISGISGGASRSGSLTDAFVAKYSPNGVLFWGKFIGGTNIESGWDVSTDPFGNVYVAGYTNHSGLTISGVSGGQTKATSNQDALIVKYNANGVILWGKFIGGLGNDQAIGIANDTSGNVYVTGYVSSFLFTLSGAQGGFTTATGNQQGFVAKYDGNGSLQWAYLLNSLGYSMSYGIDANAGIVAVAGITNTSTPTAPLTTSAQSTNTWGLVQTFTTANSLSAGPVDPTITSNPTAAPITYGQTLSGATLSGGSASVSGSFAFASPNTVPTAGTASQSVNFTPSDSTNYNTVSGISVNVTVNKANSTLVVTGATEYVLTGSPLGPDTVTRSGSTGSVTYSYTGTWSTTYEASPNRPSAIGSYMVVATLAADSNYNGITSSNFAFTIKNSSTVTITNNSPYTYNRSPLGPNASSKSGSTASVTYAYTGTGVTTYAESATRPTNAGTYSVTATLPSDATSYGASATVSFTILPKSLTIQGLAGVNKFVNGTNVAQLSGTPSLFGIIAGDTVSIAGTATAVFNNAIAGARKPITVTGYTLSGASAGNYTVAQPTGLRASINKAKQTISGFGPFRMQRVNMTLTLTLTASSGLPVTITVLSGNATVAGNVVTFLQKGVVRLQATVDGNDAYVPIVRTGSLVVKW